MLALPYVSLSGVCVSAHQQHEIIFFSAFPLLLPFSCFSPSATTSFLALLIMEIFLLSLSSHSAVYD